jgi:hypothetical protein
VKEKMSKETKGNNNTSRVMSGYGGSLEANTLAMIDSTGAKDSRDANEDRLQYLEAVRAASLVPENGIPPTNKMYQAIFRILRFGKTLELITASFQLLTQLHQRFPWVYVSDSADQLDIVDEVLVTNVLMCFCSFFVMVGMVDFMCLFMVLFCRLGHRLISGLMLILMKRIYQ